LFRAVKDGHLNDELHLAEMVSLMGPPPKEFLRRSEKSRQYWDEEGRLLPCKLFRGFTFLTN
jgi:hypothetical protein